MVRIINKEDNKNQVQQPIKLDERSKALLMIIGIVIVEKGAAIQKLLEEYSVTFSEEPDEKELAEKLISAITENHAAFNRELASVILDCTLENNFDSFDFKSLFHKNEPSQAEGGSSSGGGLLGGVTNAIGSIGQAITNRQGKQDTAGHTLKEIYTYKTQLATNASSKNKTKTVALITFLILLGIAIIGIIAYMKKQSQEASDASTSNT